jgi:transcriptional regulator with XRE-family HTH domain
MEKVARNIGNRIRALRARSNPPLTQEQLAAQAHISVSFLSLIERGQRTPHLETLQRICQVLGVTLATLFDRIDEESPAQATNTGAELESLNTLVTRYNLNAQQVSKLVEVAQHLFADRDRN